ncbi:small multi-drug export protein [Antarcticibacterium flavum]|uniref:Small multi-drug export protein n=1 Tax=Antarcticibacterium flavum TaxID=2058175 RepID=A0A5B7X3V1_9FLAO|nr:MULTISPECIES: small multi-drug export protein [Antarcticibacterium]MCM4161117.1 ligand-binding protein SH3 [Antarcticibacterium sp. W02-3]QCY69381.1 small multi-drug export protein [Antarcticibacterium flavum]
MVYDILSAMLWSISPFGEAKVGIPYAIYNDVNYYLAFTLCFAANVMVFPVMQFFLNYINRYLLRWRFYKRSAIFVARRAKIGAGGNVKKYGFWGLLVFVMMPIPGTGVYAGTIAAWLFGLERKRAFIANTVGIYFSCVIVWTITVLSVEGIN